MPELKKNILKFGYGINFKYEGMLAYSFDRFYVITKFPNCLSGISTRQLELLLWRAGPTAQHMPDSPIFLIQLNYVHNNKNQVLPPYDKFPCHKVTQHWEFHFLLINEAMQGKH